MRQLPWLGPDSGNHCRPKDRSATGSPASTEQPALGSAIRASASGGSSKLEPCQRAFVWMRRRRRRRKDHGAEDPETVPASVAEAPHAIGSRTGRVPRPHSDTCRNKADGSTTESGGAPGIHCVSAQVVRWPEGAAASTARPTRGSRWANAG